MSITVDDVGDVIFDGIQIPAVVVEELGNEFYKLNEEKNPNNLNIYFIVSVRLSLITDKGSIAKFEKINGYLYIRLNNTTYNYKLTDLTFVYNLASDSMQIKQDEFLIATIGNNGNLVVEANAQEYQSAFDDDGGGNVNIYVGKAEGIKAGKGTSINQQEYTGSLNTVDTVFTVNIIPGEYGIKDSIPFSKTCTGSATGLIGGKTLNFNSPEVTNITCDNASVDFANSTFIITPGAGSTLTFTATIEYSVTTVTRSLSSWYHAEENARTRSAGTTQTGTASATVTVPIKTDQSAMDWVKKNGEMLAMGGLTLANAGLMGATYLRFREKEAEKKKNRVTIC